MPMPTAQPPPAMPPPTAAREAARGTDDTGRAASPPVAAGRSAPVPADSVEDWYFCGEGSLYR